MNNKKTVYIHIGSPKTGTTAIQETLAANIDNLKKKNYLYPKTGLNGINHFCIPLLIQKQDSKIKTILEKLLKEFKDSNLDNLIISTEAFFYKTQTIESIKIVQEAFVDFDIKIIVYLRRQDSFLQSGYSQQVKADINRVLTVQEFVENVHNNTNIYDHYSKISKWAEVFGKENIIVQPYEKAQMPNGLFNSFFSLIGIKEDVNDYLELPTRKSNVGLSKYETELLRLFNDKKVPYEIKIKFVDYFLNQEQNSQREYDLLTYKERKDILDLYKESNAQVATEFLNREDGILFYEEIEKKEYNTIIDENVLKDCFENAAKKIPNKQEHRKLRECLFEGKEYRDSLIQKLRKKLKFSS